MSDTRYRLRKLLPSLSSQARRISEPEVKSRFHRVKRVAESTKPVRRACRQEGLSHQSFYEWAKRLLKSKDVLSLRPRSRRPKRSPRQTPKRIAKRVIKLRTAEPFQGPERISRDLKNLYNLHCPPSTVFAVLRRAGLVGKEPSRRLTKKHMKRYRRPWPGYLQMDFKYVPYRINEQQYYQLSAVDHHSSWRFIRIYAEKSKTSVMAFLRELETQCPFKILQIQTDNDAAFTDKFSSQTGAATGRHPMDLWCEQHGTEHKLIPVGQKELNGKVENTHKYDDREFFSQINPANLAQLSRFSIDYNRRWNEVRATKTLGWKTPNEVVWDAYVRAYVYLKLLQHQYQPQLPDLVAINDQGNLALPVVLEPQSVRKIKRPSSLIRYLQYLDWEKNKNLKSALILPVAMSQNFSS